MSNAVLSYNYITQATQPNKTDVKHSAGGPVLQASSGNSRKLQQNCTYCHFLAIVVAEFVGTRPRIVVGNGVSQLDIELWQSAN